MCAGVVKLVDALDSKSSGPCVRASSILASGTNHFNTLPAFPFPSFLTKFPKYPVFLNRKRTDRIKYFRGSWESACDDAGIEKRFVHDMRRSAVRNMVESGVSEKVAMELSGHLTRAVFENYHIVSTQDLVNAVQKTSKNLKKMEKPKDGQK